MQFVFTPVLNKHFNCFVLDVAHEHGDGDVTTHTEVVLRNNSIVYLEGYIKAFDTANTVIGDRCYSGIEIAKDFETTHGRFENSYIPLEHDRTAEGVPNYYAPMCIKSITYYDSNGIASLVTYTD